MASASLTDRFNLNLLSLGKAQSKLISVNLQFQGIAHRCKLHDRDLRPGYHSHIQKMLSKRALSSYLEDHGAFSDFQIPECHSYASFFSNYP